MLLPIDVRPQLSIYYLGSKVLKRIDTLGRIELLEFYTQVKQEVEISLFLFTFVLDWLYIINAINIETEGGKQIVYKIFKS